MQINKKTYTHPMTYLSLSIIICTIILASTWRGNNKLNQVITVTGSAKREIKADFARLSGTISTKGSTTLEAYAQFKAAKEKFISFLVQKGYKKEAVEEKPVNTFPVYSNTVSPNGQTVSQVSGYETTQAITVSSSDPYGIKKLSLEIASVIEIGVNFTNINTEYHCSKLNEIKVEVQADAAKNALLRAKKIAEATGSKIGDIRAGTMGVLQITPKYSTQVEDTGVNDLSSIEKEITAVVNASFEIK